MSDGHDTGKSTSQPVQPKNRIPAWTAIGAILAARRQQGGTPCPKRIPASMRTRQSLRDLIEGRLSSPDGRAEWVRLPVSKAQSLCRSRFLTVTVRQRIS
jgi:hypothetical protein